VALAAWNAARRSWFSLRPFAPQLETAFTFRAQDFPSVPSFLRDPLEWPKILTGDANNRRDTVNCPSRSRVFPFDDIADSHRLHKDFDMPSIVLIPLLFATSAASESVCRELADQCQTGTLLFSQGDCLAVKIFSGSRFTHCGAVVIEDGKPVVYDAMNRAGVRKTDLVEYLRLQTPTDLQVVHPAAPFTDSEAQAFRNYLQSQLGRPYGVKHHVTGKRATGVHCAEYLTDALMAAGKIEADQPPRVSPGSLYEGLTVHRLYLDGGQYELTAQPPHQPPAQESWRRRTWRAACECAAGCCRQMSRWFFCCEK
jgi:hypothetical protein